MSVMPLVESLPLSLSLVTEARSLDGLADEWLELMARSDSNEVTLSPEWIKSWWQVFGSSQGRALRLGVIREGERLVGLAPFVRRRHWYRGALPFRRLEFLASGENEADAISSDYLNVIAERGAEKRVADAVVQAIVSGAFGSWDEVVLPRMAGDGPMPALFVAAFRRAGIHAEMTETFSCPYLPLPGTWEEYLAALSKKPRKLIRQSMQQFEEWAAGTLHIERATTPNDLARGQKILVDLHHQRWSRPEEGGVFRSPLFLAFHDRIMQQLGAQGNVELTWASAHGRPVAAMYCFVWDERVCYYQCGRAVDLPSHLRPGIALTCYAIRDAIAAGRREFDFLKGDYQYKRQLALAARSLVEVRAVRSCLMEPLRRWVEAGATQVRRLRKAWRQWRKRTPSEPILPEAPE